tara:strand:- start:281 stop:442 length:162 start_codon:yes stop_codon:yes gene_type:complete
MPFCVSKTIIYIIYDILGSKSRVFLRGIAAQGGAALSKSVILQKKDEKSEKKA